MIIKYVFVWCLFFFSCQNPNVMNRSEEIILVSGVESMLDGSEVVCSNIATTEYVVNEEKKEGLTANIALPNQEEWLRVGEGSFFELNDKIWSVIEVRDDAVIVQQKKSN